VAQRGIEPRTQGFSVQPTILSHGFNKIFVVSVGVFNAVTVWAEQWTVFKLWLHRFLPWLVGYSSQGHVFVIRMVVKFQSRWMFIITTPLTLSAKIFNCP